MRTLGMGLSCNSKYYRIQFSFELRQADIFRRNGRGFKDFCVTWQLHICSPICLAVLRMRAHVIAG
jgi:hypothetical protein